MSLTDEEKTRLKQLAGALAAEDGTRGDHFVVELLKDHRNRIPRVEKFVENVESFIERGKSSLQGFVIGGLNAVDAVRDLGYEISATERTGAQREE